MSWLEAELREQPDALARFLRAETAAARALVDELAIREIRYVVIAARGSSDNAARYAQYLFGAVNRLPVALATPSLYTLYKTPPRLEPALVIGTAYGTAFEIALKIRELSGVQMEAFSGADLLHGPIAAVDTGSLSLLVAPSGPALEGVHELIAELRRRGVAIAAISDAPDVLAAVDTPLPLVAGVPEWLSPLTAVVPGQLAALRLASLRGLDLDHPHGLQKITRTR